MINIIIVSLITLLVSLFFESYVSNEHTYKLIYGAGDNNKKEISFNNIKYIIGTELINLDDEQTSLPKQFKLFKYLKDTVLFNPIPSLFYDDLINEYSYETSYSITKLGCHYGQRKLLINEIQFLTYYAKQTNIIIYVGAAPCEHLTVIKHLFPNNKYLLIDPNYCIIDDDKSVYIYQNPHIISNNAINIYRIYSDKTKPKHQQNGAKILTNIKVLFNDINYTYDMVTPFLNKVNLDTHKQLMINICNDAKLKMKNNNILKSIENNLDYDIFIIQDYLDINLLELISLNINEVKSNILFISDLRTSFYKNELSDTLNNYMNISNGPVDADILHNDCLQMLACHYIKPSYAMLKFHPPYFYEEWKQYSKYLQDNNTLKQVVEQVSREIFKKDDEFLFKEHFNKRHYNYKAERILLQPWAPPISSETRLIISKKTIIDREIIVYNSSQWENKFFIHNITRPYVSIPTYLYLTNDLANLNSEFKIYGYDCCPDCYIELTILYQYCKKKKYINFKNIELYSPDISEQKKYFPDIKKLCAIISKCLPYKLIDSYNYINKNTNYKCNFHGYNFPHIENHILFQIQNKSVNPISKKLYKVIISKKEPIPKIQLIKDSTDLKIYEFSNKLITNKLIKLIIKKFPPTFQDESI